MVKKMTLNNKYYTKIIFLVAVFFTPISFLLFFHNAFFTEIGWIDPFLYIGYGLNYTDPSYLSTYYKISRLPWIWMEFLFRNLLQEKISSYVLHFTIYSAVSYLIFQVLIKNFGTIAAFTITITTPLFLYIYSGSPDYHNNFSAILFLGLIFYIINATSKSLDNGNKFFLIIGVIYAIIIHTNLLLAFDSAIYALCTYVALKIEKQQQNDIFKSFFKKLLLIIGGFLFCTLVFCLVNYSVGRYFWFMKSLFNFTIDYANSGSRIRVLFKDFLSGASYLSHFFAMFIFSIFMALYLKVKNLHYSNPLVFLLNIAFIFSFLEMLITHSLELNNLDFVYIAFSYLIPFLLTFGANLGFIFKDSEIELKKEKILAIVLASSIFLVILYFNRPLISSFLSKENIFFDLAILWTVVFFVLFLCRNFIKRYASLIFLLIIIILFLQAKTSDIKFQSYHTNASCNSAKSMDEFYTEFDDHIKKYKKDFTVNTVGNVFFWWNKNQNINYNSCASKISPLTLLARSTVCGGTSAYQLDNAWAKDGISNIDKLWQTLGPDGTNIFKTDFFNSGKYPRVIIMLTYDENDVSKMIHKMKSYGLKFILSEKRKAMTDAFTVEYYVLIESKN